MRGHKLVQILRLFFIAAAAAAMVACVYWLDAHRQHSNQAALSLRWARQMVTQAESLSLAGASVGERDPLSWAVRLLSQGTDTKIIYASKALVTPPVVEPEMYSLDPASGIFEYTKISDPLQGTGIRIRLYTTHLGFLGARTKLQNDCTFASFFLLISVFLYFCFPPQKVSKEETITPQQETQAEPVLMPLILAWVAEAKKSLIELGGNIREMVRASKNLSLASREAKSNIGSLRFKLHQQLSELHAKAKEEPTQSLGAIAEEVERVLTQGQSLDPKIQAVLKKMLGRLIDQARDLQAVELELEPLITDADMIVSGLEMVERESAVLTAATKLTIQGMLDQSRKVGELTEIRDSTKCQADVAASRAVRSS